MKVQGLIPKGKGKPAEFTNGVVTGGMVRQLWWGGGGTPAVQAQLMHTLIFKGCVQPTPFLSQPPLDPALFLLVTMFPLRVGNSLA